MKTKLAVNRLINSVWTIEYVDNLNGSATLISYSRDDCRGYEQENELPIARLVEDGKRNVIGLRLWLHSTPGDEAPLEFSIANPRNIFTYKGVA